MTSLCIHKCVNINIIANIYRIILVKLVEIQLSIHTKVTDKLIIKELRNYRMQTNVNDLTVSTRVEQQTVLNLIYIQLEITK